MDRCIQIGKSFSDYLSHFIKNTSIWHYRLFYNKEIDIASAAGINDPVDSFTPALNRQDDGEFVS
jgi:hypothetical protein